MYLFGHIGITLFLATLFSLSWLFAMAGVLLPDAVDKILFFNGIAPCARFISHSIFFGPVVGLITYLVTRRRDYTLAIIFGSYLHLFEDVLNFSVPWFYPLIQYKFDCLPTYEITFTPYIITAEIIGIALILIVLKFRIKLMGIGSKTLKKIFKF